MILKSVVGNFNKKIIVSIEGKNYELDFNIIGEVDVKDNKLANAIKEKYKGYIWGKEDEVEIPKTKEEKITEEYVNKLKDNILSLEESLKNKKEELVIVNEDLKVWKNKAQEIITQKENDNKAFEEEVNKFNILLKRSQLEVGLWKSSVKDLKKLCEGSNFKKEEYEKFTLKEEFIDYILNKE